MPLHWEIKRKRWINLQLKRCISPHFASFLLSPRSLYKSEAVVIASEHAFSHAELRLTSMWVIPSSKGLKPRIRAGSLRKIERNLKKTVNSAEVFPSGPSLRSTTTPVCCSRCLEMSILTRSTLLVRGLGLRQKRNVLEPP